jgi:hypothetical protein
MSERTSKRLRKGVILVVVFGLGLTFSLMAIYGSNPNDPNNPFRNFIPPPQNRIVRIDESKDPVTFQNFMPYGMISIKYTDKSANQFTVWTTPYAGKGSWLVTGTDEQIAAELKLNSAADLYCSNGSAKIFYGINLNDPARMCGLLFAANGDWHIIDQFHALIGSADLSGALAYVLTVQK